MSAGDLAEAIRTSERIVVLTGAGISTESGIPDFRSDQGVWAKADPMEVGSIQGFYESPKRFYDFWGNFFAGLGDVAPNAMHTLLADLEREGKVRAIITQNVDGLHQRAGSQRVIEAHGNWERTRCSDCGAKGSWQDIVDEARAGRVPTCGQCGGILRPDVVLFGEALGVAFTEAEEATRGADLFIAMGTSLEVAPVSGLPHLARDRGATVAIVNREPTGHDRVADLIVRGELGRIAAELRAQLARARRP